MGKKKTQLQIAQEEAELAIAQTNKRIETLGGHTSTIYDELNKIQECFDKIRNVPTEKRLEYEKLKSIRLSWKTQAEKIDSDYKAAVAKNSGGGVAGVGAGVAVAALGPTAAMGIATTFGVASTGTAISALSGAAATNAALAWLGGGALAVGGGGMAAGNALLTLAGPVGWAIAGVALLTSGIVFLIGRSDKKRLENVFTLISKRDVKSYELAMVEINERIEHIIDESGKLKDAIKKVISFGTDYNSMTEEQQYELGAYVNLMNSSTQLLVNPIMGLQPKYTEEDLKNYEADHQPIVDDKKKQLIILLSNLLFKIEMDDKDKKLLWKSFKGNKKFLESVGMGKKEFDYSLVTTVIDALKSKQQKAERA